MTEAILNVIGWINDIILGVGENGSSLTNSMGEYMPTIFEYAHAIMTSIMMPVAYVILALFFLLEIQKASTRIEASGGGNQLGAEMIFKIMLKLALCKIAIDFAPTILEAMYSVTTYLTRQVYDIVASDTLGIGIDTAALEPMLDSLGFWTALICLILCFVVYLVTMVAVAIANIIVVTRFIELYVYFALAPIPMATFPSDELSQIGKGFLKSFFSVSIQGTIIFIVLTFYPILFNAAFSNAGNEDIFSSLLKILGYAIVLVLAVFSSGKWAKAISNAV